MRPEKACCEPKQPTWPAGCPQVCSVGMARSWRVSCRFPHESAPWALGTVKHQDHPDFPHSPCVHTLSLAGWRGSATGTRTCHGCHTGSSPVARRAPSRRDWAAPCPSSGVFFPALHAGPNFVLCRADLPASEGRGERPAAIMAACSTRLLESPRSHVYFCLA